MEIFKYSKDSDFLNNFYDKTQIYSSEMYRIFSEKINKNADSIRKAFHEDEIIGILILNKIYFQHICSFFYLIESNLYIPAFNEQRAAFEYLRLFRVFIMDKDFRENYLKNDNIDFRNVRDDNFMQRRVTKRLDDLENELRNQEYIPMSNILFNHNFTKGSSFSQIHSELSKWSHGINCNLIFPLFIDNEHRISLSIYNKESNTSETFIKKYLELSYLNLSEHYRLLSSLVDFGNEFEKKSDEMLSLYEQYIKLFYK